MSQDYEENSSCVENDEENDSSFDGDNNNILTFLDQFAPMLRH